MLARFCGVQRKKPPSPKNNYGYSLQDRIVCGDAGRWECALPQVGGLPFWVFSVAMIWRRGDTGDLPGLFGFGPKPGYFVVQKRNETPQTPETLETPETLTVAVRIAFL